MSNIKLFESTQIRSVWLEDEKQWFFSVVDVVGALTGSAKPRDYWYRIKQREKISGIELSTICRQLKLPSPDGKERETDCADAEGLLRIIQSIPSPKAEPFKRWLAQVGYERLQEIENPELAAQRMRAIYQSKGYSPEWIEKRVRGIAIRDELTGEWQKRGVKEQREYAILTAEISKATFGMTPSEYRDLKELGQTNDNLRDHMSDLELIFTMLGEASTTEITRQHDAQGFGPNRSAARAGGKVAGNARRDLERKSGRKVATNQNYKQLPEAEVRKRIPKNKVKSGDTL
jgi:prophage antirepressor-like protein